MVSNLRAKRRWNLWPLAGVNSKKKSSRRLYLFRELVSRCHVPDSTTTPIWIYLNNVEIPFIQIPLHASLTHCNLLFSFAFGPPTLSFEFNHLVHVHTKSKEPIGTGGCCFTFWCPCFAFCKASNDSKVDDLGWVYAALGLIGCNLIGATVLSMHIEEKRGLKKHGCAWVSLNRQGVACVF